jgi:hypothetical protein
MEVICVSFMEANKSIILDMRVETRRNQNSSMRSAACEAIVNVDVGT